MSDVWNKGRMCHRMNDLTGSPFTESAACASGLVYIALVHYFFMANNVLSKQELIRLVMLDCISTHMMYNKTSIQPISTCIEIQPLVTEMLHSVTDGRVMVLEERITRAQGF